MFCFCLWFVGCAAADHVPTAAVTNERLRAAVDKTCASLSPSLSSALHVPSSDIYYNILNVFVVALTIFNTGICQQTIGGYVTRIANVNTL